MFVETERSETDTQRGSRFWPSRRALSWRTAWRSSWISAATARPRARATGRPTAAACGRPRGPGSAPDRRGRRRAGVRRPRGCADPLLGRERFRLLKRSALAAGGLAERRQFFSSRWMPRSMSAARSSWPASRASFSSARACSSFFSSAARRSSPPGLSRGVPGSCAPLSRAVPASRARRPGPGPPGRRLQFVRLLLELAHLIAQLFRPGFVRPCRGGAGHQAGRGHADRPLPPSAIQSARLHVALSFLAFISVRPAFPSMGNCPSGRRRGLFRAAGGPAEEAALRVEAQPVETDEAVPLDVRGPLLVVDDHHWPAPS